MHPPSLAALNFLSCPPFAHLNSFQTSSAEAHRQGFPRSWLAGWDALTSRVTPPAPLLPLLPSSYYYYVCMYERSMYASPLAWWSLHRATSLASSLDVCTLSASLPSRLTLYLATARHGASGSGSGQHIRGGEKGCAAHINDRPSKQNPYPAFSPPPLPLSGKTPIVNPYSQQNPTLLPLSPRLSRYDVNRAEISLVSKAETMACLFCFLFSSAVDKRYFFFICVLISAYAFARPHA